jgi:hypothetical protein
MALLSLVGAVWVFAGVRVLLAGDPLVTVGSAIPAVTVVLCSMAYLFLPLGGYPAVVWGPRVIAAGWAAGSMPLGYGLGVRVLGLPAAAALALALLAAVSIAPMMERSFRLNVASVLIASAGYVSTSHADQMVRYCRRLLESATLKPEQRKTLEIGLARALVHLSPAGEFPDGLIEATDLLRSVLADPPRDPTLLFTATHDLVKAMSAKATKHDDLTGYRESLDLLTEAVRRLPAGSGATARMYEAFATYHMALAAHPTIGPAAGEAEMDAAVAALRDAIEAAPKVEKALCADLHAVLGASLGARAETPAEFDQAIQVCRTGQRVAGRSTKRRSESDLALALLLTDRALAVAATFGATTATAESVAATGDSVAADLGEAEMLCRRLARHRGAGQRMGALEQLATVLAVREHLFGDFHSLTEIGAGWRAAYQESLVDSVPSTLRIAGSWVEWAVFTRDVDQCAEAFHHLMSAIPRAAAARYLPSEKEHLLSRTQHSAEEAGYWLIRAGRRRDAAVALELGRAVVITEVTARDRPDLAGVLQRVGRPDLHQRYREAVHRLATTERQPGAPAPRFSSPLHRAWADYDAVAREIADLEGVERAVGEVNYADIASATIEGPLVYLAAADDLGYALIVTGAGDPGLVELPLLTRVRVREQVRVWSGRPDPVSLRASITWLWENGIDELSHALPTGALVTLVPVGLLGLLPIHAAGRRRPDATADGPWEHLTDFAAVRYAPNARTLVRSIGRAAALTGRHLSLLAADAPNGAGHPRPIPHADREAGEIHRRWCARGGTGTRLPEARAADVWRALPAHQVWHFACHGVAYPDRILDSGLLFSDQQLTLRQLLALLPASRRLAVLSACETHITGHGLPDEVLGLPGGLLQLGLAGVLASHWKVADDAAMFLLIRFYELWRDEGLPPPRALAAAQRWLRDANNGELHDYRPDLCPAPPTDQPPETVRRWSTHRPFAAPEEWAAFSLTGA